MPSLSTRVLNRTYLRRQFLDGGSARTPLEVVTHLIALQGQENDAPYLGLRARLDRFGIAQLRELLESRHIVRSALLRGTQHLCSGTDYAWLRPTLQPVLNKLTGRIAKPDPAALVTTIGQILAAEPLPRAELGRRLAVEFPGCPASDLSMAAHLMSPLLHPPPSGLWGHRGRIRCVAADAWLGRPTAPPDVSMLVMRYLAAYGPASVKDFQTFTGLTRMTPIFQDLPLSVVKGENGIELYDVPDAPLADPDAPAPVVFLPEFDNAVLGHADRARIIHPGDRAIVTPGWSIVRPTVLVDGFVAATWERERGALRVHPFRPWSAGQRDEVMAEAERLARFVDPDSPPPVILSVPGQSPSGPAFVDKVK